MIKRIKIILRVWPWVLLDLMVLGCPETYLTLRSGWKTSDNQTQVLSLSSYLYLIYYILISRTPLVSPPTASKAHFSQSEHLTKPLTNAQQRMPNKNCRVSSSLMYPQNLHHYRPKWNTVILHKPRFPWNSRGFPFHFGWLHNLLFQPPNCQIDL